MLQMIKCDDRAEWLDKRSKRIGGSEASAVIGVNPFKSNVELWEEKTGRRTSKDISDNPIVKYGQEAEFHLRELFKLDFPHYIVNYVENNMFINDKFPFAHASLDGWLTDEQGRKGILEIKTSNIINQNMKDKWDNQIPDNYYVQVLHYLMVMEAEFAVIKAQLKWDYEDLYLQTRHYFIERKDVEEDIEYLMQAEKDFYDCILEDKSPALILPNI